MKTTGHDKTQKPNDNRIGFGISKSASERSGGEGQGLGASESRKTARDTQAVQSCEQEKDSYPKTRLAEEQPGKAQRREQALEDQSRVKAVRLCGTLSETEWGLCDLSIDRYGTSQVRTTKYRSLPRNRRSAGPALSSLQFDAGTSEGQYCNAKNCDCVLGKSGPEKKVAALFVEKNGPYSQILCVDVWDIERDARKYAGPYPVICHSPCERWGRYWSGGPNPKAARRKRGDDGGCFEAALNAILKWGGVIEHPAGSYAWEHFGILPPPADGGWQSQFYRGQVIWTCQVEQGNYGHRARKATWLLVAHATDLPVLKWGQSSGVRIDEGFHTNDERARAAGIKPVKRISKKELVHTPIQFRDQLVAIARQGRSE